MKLIPAQVSFVFLSLTVTASAKKKGCEYPTHLSQTNKSGEHQIAPLIGERYEINDGSYTYYIGICAEAMDPYPQESAQRLSGSGVVQMNQDGKLRIIGKFDHADIMAGPEWVMLEYNAGDTYGTHCIGDNNETENRRARIMFTCDPNQVEGPGIKGFDKDEGKKKCRVCVHQPFLRMFSDGCDLICRTGKHRQPRTYKGIGDDQLQDTDDQTIYFLYKPV